MKIVRTSELASTSARTLWKNGQGFTTQLMIEPEGIQFPTDADRGPFHWRVSCAEISVDNEFSSFPGYDRWLIVWKGEGVILNGESLPPFSPLFFYGEELMKCRLERGPVIDLGLIFNRDLYRASVEVMTMESTTIGHKQGTLLLFCAEKSVEVNGTLLNVGDLARFDTPTVVEVFDNSRTLILRINELSI